MRLSAQGARRPDRGRGGIQVGLGRLPTGAVGAGREGHTPDCERGNGCCAHCAHWEAPRSARWAPSLAEAPTHCHCRPIWTPPLLVPASSPFCCRCDLSHCYGSLWRQEEDGVIAAGAGVGRLTRISGCQLHPSRRPPPAWRLNLTFTRLAASATPHCRKSVGLQCGVGAVGLRDGVLVGKSQGPGHRPRYGERGQCVLV